ncbi:MAG: amidohydrolase family protein, partial [Conexivisphaerales archaeon]
WGNRPVEYLYKRGFLGNRVIAAHSAFLTDDEVRMYAETGTNPVHCPTINMSYMTFPKIPTMLRSGVNVALGTDGGSYRGLDMFTEMNVAMAAMIANYGTPYYDFSSISLSAMLKMGTRNGYLAIGEPKGGEIRTGYRADIILIDRLIPHLVPLHDLKALPLFATGNDVSDLIVDGKVIMRDHQVLTMNEEEIVTKIQEISPQVMERIKRIVKT